MWLILKLIVSVVGTVALSIPMVFIVGLALDRLGMMHYWGFWHGGILFAWPLCLFLSAWIIYLCWYRQNKQIIEKREGII